MKKFLPWLLLGTSVVEANEALDFLAKDLPHPGQVYLDSQPEPSRAEKEKKKPASPPDPELPPRWEPELPVAVSFGDPLTMRIAPRGLFEYQYQDQSITRGARLSRARVGLALETYYGVELQADLLLSSGGDYEGWDTLKIEAPISGDVRLSLGKFPPQFSTEYSRDASRRWFPTLSPLVAQIAPASSLGVMVEGGNDAFEWKAGWFSGDLARGIPGIEGKGYFYGRVATSRNGGGVDGRAPAFRGFHLDYIYNADRDENEAIPSDYRHLFATGVQMSTGPFDFYSDFLLARGDDQTVWGVTAAGGYWVVQDAVRLVARYHYAQSREDGGLLVGWGVPSTATGAVLPFGAPASSAASELHSFYGGLNFHLFEDNFILGTGVEYRELSGVVGRKDFNSWGWNTWARLAF